MDQALRPNLSSCAWMVASMAASISCTCCSLRLAIHESSLKSDAFHTEESDTGLSGSPWVASPLPGSTAGGRSGVTRPGMACRHPCSACAMPF